MKLFWDVRRPFCFGRRRGVDLFETWCLFYSFMVCVMYVCMCHVSCCALIRLQVLLLVLLVHLSRPRRVHPAGAVTQSSDVDDVLEDFSSEDPSSSVNHAFAKDELEAVRLMKFTMRNCNVNRCHSKGEPGLISFPLTPQLWLWTRVHAVEANPHSKAREENSRWDAKLEDFQANLLLKIMPANWLV